VPDGWICYLEIPATDVDASADFYAAVFGWKVMVDDIETTLDKGLAAGGGIGTPLTAIGTGGEAFATFRDPVGNVFGLYQERRSWGVPCSRHPRGPAGRGRVRNHADISRPCHPEVLDAFLQDRL
jgi:catechol 2,3-dioxygenase-like lactoylglutathione lyase family enzyme